MITAQEIKVIWWFSWPKIYEEQKRDSACRISGKREFTTGNTAMILAGQQRSQGVEFLNEIPIQTSKRIKYHGVTIRGTLGHHMDGCCQKADVAAVKLAHLISHNPGCWISQGRRATSGQYWQVRMPRSYFMRLQFGQRWSTRYRSIRPARIRVNGTYY